MTEPTRTLAELAGTWAITKSETGEQGAELEQLRAEARRSLGEQKE